MRIISYNILACKPWPTDSPRAKSILDKNQIIERLALELALYDADIITFSESGNEDSMKKLAALLNMNHIRFPSAGSWPGTILTRYDVLESKNVPVVSGQRPEELFTRHWGRAVVKLDNGKALILHSAHLYPFKDEKGCKIRLREVEQMLEQMRSDLDLGRSILLAGDLNHTPDMKANSMFTQAGFVDTFAKVGKGKGFTIEADTPKKRIDYIMMAGPLSKTITESRPLFEGAFRTNPDDPNSIALSDHLPQMAEFS